MPAEVVDEAGDLGNLQSILSVVGPENPLQEVALSLVPVGAGYEATVTLPEMYYGNLDFELSFSDIAQNEPLGSCVDTTTLTRNQTSVECELTLRTRSAIGGNLLSTVGLNVFDLDGAPVSGAVVSVDGQDIAITNSATFSTPGYSKIYLNPGARDIVVRNGDSFGELLYTSVPLSVDNIDITLDQIDPVSTGFVQALWSFSGVASYSMSETVLNINVGSGGGGLVATTIVPSDGVISFDWAMSVFSAGQFGDVISYSINGNSVTLSSAGSASGSVTNIPVSAGDELLLNTWGTTQSSSYAANFSNYNFVAN